MKPTTEQLEAILFLQGGAAGKLYIEYLRDLLSQTNKIAAYSEEQVNKNHLSGRSQQLYELIELFEKANDKLEARKTLERTPQ